MEIRLRVESAVRDEAEELTSALHDWLREDRDVGRHARIGRLTDPGPAPGGAMSADWFGWVQLIVGSGFSTAGLVYAHKAFRASLPRHQQSVPVVIERDGTRIVLRDASPEAAARIARILSGSGDDEEASGGSS
ncbi:hypothetical protein ACF1GS_08870 [Streptomyces eurythermus]|uniref:effector-associated constant component EACC1 n=1 Tax=Streptomyces eurythermus TaxID=42237 RepID=UPI0036FF7F0E